MAFKQMSGVPARIGVRDYATPPVASPVSAAGVARNAEERR
jgi:hypothetical protein